MRFVQLGMHSEVYIYRCSSDAQVMPITSILRRITLRDINFRTCQIMSPRLLQCVRLWALGNYNVSGYGPSVLGRLGLLTLNFTTCQVMGLRFYVATGYGP